MRIIKTNFVMSKEFFHFVFGKSFAGIHMIIMIDDERLLRVTLFTNAGNHRRELVSLSDGFFSAAVVRVSNATIAALRDSLFLHSNCARVICIWKGGRERSRGTAYALHTFCAAAQLKGHDDVIPI